jgi:cytochrome c oxidase cbb3-type subunit 4
MDWLNDMRVLVTLSSFAAFVGVVLWAYAPALRSRFDADAAIPFLDDDGLLSEKAGARQAAGVKGRAAAQQNSGRATEQQTLAGK